MSAYIDFGYAAINCNSVLKVYYEFSIHQFREIEELVDLRLGYKSLFSDCYFSVATSPEEFSLGDEYDAFCLGDKRPRQAPEV